MIRLHSYWRSSAAYRVRIALNLKGVAYAQTAHDLRTGAQRAPTFLALNPQGFVPALELDDGTVLPQSSAILAWLEESVSAPALLPAGTTERAIVRAMAALIANDIHPLNNLRVLTELRQTFAADEAAIRGWIAHWITNGFAALETLIVRHGKGFAFGTVPTIADCCLVPQLYSAERFGIDLHPFPHLVAAGATARAVPAFADAHPDRQPDADR